MLTDKPSGEAQQKQSLAPGSGPGRLGGWSQDSHSKGKGVQTVKTQYRAFEGQLETAGAMLIVLVWTAAPPRR